MLASCCLLSLHRKHFPFHLQTDLSSAEITKKKLFSRMCTCYLFPLNEKNTLLTQFTFLFLLLLLFNLFSIIFGRLNRDQRINILISFDCFEQLHKVVNKFILKINKYILTAVPSILICIYKMH